MATASSSAAAVSQLDVVFDGTWVLDPILDAAGQIVGVDVYSPSCGHPHGATYVNQLNPNPWPDSSAFYMLDDHGHILEIQRGSGPHPSMNASSVNMTVNHCIPKGRPIGSNWDLMISIKAGPDAWASADTVTPQTTNSMGQTVACFSGKDIPTGKVSSLQTLSFKGVTKASLCGAPAKVQALLPSPWNGNGSLIFEGEVPYFPTLQHERSAVAAMANLAGLDLSLDYPLPSSLSAQPSPAVLRPMMKTGGNCGHSVILLP
jgi:hypothetical protein